MAQVKLNRYGLPVNKKSVTQKQLEALQKGREKRTAKIHAEQYVKSLRKEQRAMEARGEKKPITTFQRFENKIKRKMQEYEQLGVKLTRTQAIAKVTASATYKTQDEIYTDAIKSYITVGERNRIRKALSVIKRTPYKQTTLDWSEFRIENGKLIHSSGMITVRIRDGRDASKDPSSIVVETNVSTEGVSENK